MRRLGFRIPVVLFGYQDTEKETQPEATARIAFEAEQRINEKGDLRAHFGTPVPHIEGGKPKISSVHFYGNGNVLVISDGEQVGELQENLFSLWAKLATELGYEAEGVQIVTDSAIWKLFKVEGGFNIEKV